MKHSDSLLLTRIIGLPSIEPIRFFDLTEADFARLFPLAIKNKVPVLFLEKALEQSPDSEYLQKTYQIYLKRVTSAKNLIKYVVEVLGRAQLDYAIFKTIKPFPAFGADVDVILFNRRDFYRGWHSLAVHGCKLEGHGAFSATFLNVASQINVDLHFQIAVSRLVYMDVQLLREHVVKINFDGMLVPVLDSPASLVTDATHSIYKEQSLTLSDFYCVISEVVGKNCQQLESMLDLTMKTHASLSAKSVLVLADRLVRNTFNNSIPEVAKAAELIQVNRVEKKVINFLVTHLEQEFKLPYGYPPLAVAASFASKISNDPTMRGTLVRQFLETITNVPYLWENIRLHMKGEAS
jgi:hypothetical protein